jgi:rhodanese-related sulfurtransferase
MEKIIVDVRETWEFDTSHHPGSINYPLSEISDKIESLKKYEKVYLVCQSGNRANIAKSLLNKFGINCENLGSWQNAQKIGQ